MKLLKIPFLVLMVVTLFSSCRKDDNGGGNSGGTENSSLEVKMIENLYAPTTVSDQDTTPVEFVKFNLATGTTTTSDTDWDIAFRGTTILVNGGTQSGTVLEPERTGNAAAYIANGTFNDITSVNTSLFKQDANAVLAIPTGSGNGWYLYNMNTHIISPVAGKILVFRTHDDKYAKMEILDYYDAQGNARHYSFKYVYQPNGTSF